MPRPAATQPKRRAKRGTVIAEPGQPLRFVDVTDTGAAGTAAPRETARLAETLKAYQKAAHALLGGKYAGVRDLVPPHMRDATVIFVLQCSDGVLVRYDPTGDDDPKVRFAATAASLTEAAPKFSEQVLHFPLDPASYDPDPDGPSLTFTLRNLADGVAQEWMTMRPRIYASTKLPDGFQIPPPPERPICLASIESEIQIELGGVVAPSGEPTGLNNAGVHRFIARSRISLPVGWRAIEVYPLLGGQHWKPEYARTWAELDILAAIAQRNLRDQELRALDSRAETRKAYVALLAEFESLLKGPEEPVHQFLKQHSELIAPTSDKSWSKLPFGDTISDFVFREPHNDYELVEIEAPIRELFRKDGQQRQELTHAVKQTTDWITYIQDHKQNVEVELGLTGISTNPRTLVVIGRSAGLTEGNRREITTLQNQHNKLRILTYDDLLACARANLEHILGPLTLTGRNVDLYFF